MVNATIADIAIKRIANMVDPELGLNTQLEAAFQQLMLAVLTKPPKVALLKLIYWLSRSPQPAFMGITMTRIPGHAPMGHKESCKSQRTLSE